MSVRPLLGLGFGQELLVLDHKPLVDALADGAGVVKGGDGEGELAVLFHVIISVISSFFGGSIKLSKPTGPSFFII